MGPSGAGGSDSNEPVGLKTNPPGMSSSEAGGGATALERRRKSRSNRPESLRKKERATSRHRMAVYRARKKAEKSVRLLKLRLGESERAAVEARSAAKRHEILCDWFRSHRVNFDPRIRFTKEVVESFVSKVEMHQVELLVAEYELAIMTGIGEGGDALDEGEAGARSFDDGSHQAPSSKEGGGGRGRSTKGVATASQQQGGPIGIRGIARANSMPARAFGGGNYQAASTMTREAGDKGQLLKKRVTVDSTSTQAFFGSSYQERLKGEIKHYLPSQMPGDGGHAPTRRPDSAGAQLFDPRLSDDQVDDFLSCFESNLAEESAPTHSSSSNSQAFCDSFVRALPNNDEIDSFFANCKTTKGEDFSAILPSNEGGDAGPARVFSEDSLQEKIASLEAQLETRVFGEGHLPDTASSSTGAETIPSASSRSIFGGEGPGPAPPSKTASMYGEGVAPTGGGGGEVSRMMSVDGDSDDFDAESLDMVLGLEEEGVDPDLFPW